MRISELHEGFVDSFKKGYAKTAPADPDASSSPAPTETPADDKKQAVFSMLDPRDTKKILANIINGQTLDNRQMSLIKKMYNKL
jgi:hypothetical protein